MTDQERAVLAIIQRWFNEVWNQGRLDTIDELLAEECVAQGITGADGNPLKGPSAFRAFVQGVRQAFPDIHINIEDSLIVGDRAAFRCRVRATHAADGFAGPATQRPVDYLGMVMIRVAGGKIVEAWNNFDSLRMYQQLGLVQLQPRPALESFQY